MLQPLPRLVVLVALIAACGKKSDSSRAKDDAAPGKPAVAPLAMPALGVDRVTRFGFIYGDGAAAYELAVRKAKARDWAAVRADCETAIAKDPLHLDAQWLLAIALAQTGEHAAAVEHLATAIATDDYKYGAAFATDPDLKDFRSTPHGQAVSALAQQIHDEYARRVKSGLWLIGRRSTFKWPERPGVQPGASRGELYAFDRETKRYLRLSHTDHQVAGFVRAPSGNEVALLGYDRIDHPKDEAPPLLARAYVIAIDTMEWKPAGPRIVLAPAREVSVGYDANDQLLVTTAAATGRWTLGEPTVSSVDRSTGKLAKVAVAPPVPRVAFTLDEGRLVHAPEGVEAAWSRDPPTTSSLKTAGGATIRVPESGQASQASLAVAAGGVRVAFATAVDPCAKDAAPSLYVADGKTGALKHLLTARSRFATRWLDPTTLAYEDGDGAIRLWDATTGREAMRLDDKPGLALDVLSLASAPLCKQAPPTAEPAGSGEEPLPPEDNGGPVTAPQP